MRKWTTAVAVVAVAVITSGCVTVVRSSVSSNGVQGDLPSGQYRGNTISDSGRFVAFESIATNLVPGDTNGQRDVFRRDNVTGETIRVSVANNGAQLGLPSSGNALSGDGNHVAFTTEAALEPGDTNGLLDVYVRTISTGTTEWVSRQPDGTPILTGGFQAGFGNVTLSADGNVVLMLRSSLSSTIFRRDRTTDTTVQDPSDPQTLLLSNDGKHYVWSQSCGQTGPCLGTTNLRTIADDGTLTGEPVEPTGCGFWAYDISADGSYIVGERFANMPQFQCDGPFGLVRWNRATKRFAPVPVGNYSRDWVKISNSGRIISVLNGGELHVVDMATGDVQVASTDAFGRPGPARPTAAALSGNGRYVTFATQSPITTDDDNNMEDVFTRYSIRPSVTELDPPGVIRSSVGSNLNAVTIRGRGFLPGAAVSVSGPGLVIESVTVDSPLSLTAKIRVESTATLGARTLVVSNTGGFGHADAFCVDCLTVRTPF